MNINNILVKAESSLEENNFSAAKSFFLKALKKVPHHIDSLNKLAFIEIKEGNKENAIKFLEKSLIFNPSQSQIYSNLALCQHELKDSSNALENLNKAIAIDSTSALYFFNRGKVFSEINEFNNAEMDYLKAIELNKDYYQAYLNLGVIYNKQFKYKNACIVFEKLLARNPEFSDVYYNLGVSYDNNKNIDKAIKYYNKAIERDQKNYHAMFNLSCIYLQQKKFIEGWKLFQYRWIKTNKPLFIKNIPECRNINNLSDVLLWGEQGIGDQILHSSMIKDLNLKQKITIALDERLISLYKRSFPEINFVNLNNSLSTQKFSYQIPLGSLGQFLRGNQDSFNKKSSFLNANHEEIKKIKKDFSVEGKKICGLSWRSVNQITGNAKSILLEELVPILKLENFTFVDLQYGETYKEKKEIEAKYNIKINSIESLDKLNNIDGLASLISACDLVISISNVTTHLAGALGVKTYLLAPYTLGAIYYWHEGTKNLWYPTLRILRQEAPNNWSNVVNKLAKLLK